jgi:hypothetical protein
MHCFGLVFLIIIVLLFAEEIIHLAKGAVLWIGGYFAILGTVLGAFGLASWAALAFFGHLGRYIGSDAATDILNGLIVLAIFGGLPALFLDSIHHFALTRRIFRFFARRITNGVPKTA